MRTVTLIAHRRILYKILTILISTIIIIFLLNLTSYSTTLRVISSGGGLGLNGSEVDRGKFSVLVMVSELLERAEEKRDGTEKDFLRFWRDGHEKK